MKRIICFTLIFFHFFSVCLRDASFAKEAKLVVSANSASKAPAAKMAVVAQAGASASAAVSLPFKPISVFNSFRIEPVTGQAYYPIPIEVPPGRKNLQPEINIEYSSSNPNGYLGMGWGLNLGYIERSTKLGVPKYNNEDKFYISFREFRSELEINSGKGTYWLKESPSYLKLVFDGSSWKAFDSRGNTYYFGYSAQARVSGSKGTSRWFLNKIVDSCGRYLVISYKNDGDGVYPLKIEYTGNELNRDLPANSVEFIWEEREDVVYDFHSGMPVVMDKRLRHIETRAGTKLARRYAFEYKYSAVTRRSLLAKVTAFGSDGAGSLPPLVFSYQDEKPEYIRHLNDSPKGNVQWQIAGANIEKDIKGFLYPDGRISQTSGIFYWRGYIGVNGEGSWTWDDSPGIMIIDSKGSLSFDMRPNFALHFSTYLYVNQEKTITIPAAGNCNMKYFLNGDYEHPYDFSTPLILNKGYNLFEITGYNTAGRSTFNLNFPVTDNVDAMNSFQGSLPLLSGDFNGDGRSDLGEFTGDQYWYVQLSAGDRFLPKKNWGRLGLESLGGAIPFLGDFDGDGKTDMGFSAGYWWSTGSSSMWHLSGSDSGDLPAVADFNGDGKSEMGYYRKANGNWYVDLKGIGVKPFINGFGGKGWIMHLGDFNGDGLTDAAVSNEAGDWKVALSDGTRFIEQGVWLVNFAKDKAVTVADFNYDGLSDIGYIDKDAGKVIFRASTGAKFKDKDEEWINGLNTDGQADIVLQVGDFNGDGILDPYIFNPASGYSILGYSIGELPDLLAKVENGLGAAVSLTYTPSSGYDNKIYKDGRAVGEGMPVIAPLLSGVEISDGLGSVYTTTYAYEGGVYDASRREFDSFRHIKQTDNEGNITDTYYDYSFAFKMKPVRIEKKDRSGKICEKIKNIWSNRSFGDPAKGWEGRLGRFSYILYQNKDAYDEKGILFKETSVTYNYDDYGNLICTANRGEAGPAQDELVSGYRYLYNTASDGRVLSVPSTQAYAHSDYFDWDHRYFQAYYDTGNYSSQLNRTTKWLFYDNNSAYDAPPVEGLLTKEVLAGDDTYNVDSPNNPVTSYAYDVYGNLISTIDSRGGVSAKLYDATHTFPIEAVNPLGHKTRLTYDVKTGQVLTAIDANNQKTENIYDALGRLIKVIGPGDSVAYPGIIYEYDFSRYPLRITEKKKVNNFPVSFVYPDYYVIYYFYDGLGRLIQVKSPAENDPQSGRARQVVSDAVKYNHAGQVKEKYIPYFAAFSDSYNPDFSAQPKFTFSYDCLGRLIQTVNPDGTVSSRSYSGLSVTKTDENGHQRRSVFDGLGRLIKQEEFNAGQVYATAYKYSIFGDLVEIKDAAGNLTTIEYDVLRRKVSITDPDMGKWFYTYDKSGNLKTQKDAKNQIINFEYDALNRLTKKTNPANAAIAAYAYDDPAKQNSIGRLSKTTGSSGSNEFFYDKLGRETKFIKTVDGQSYNVERAYDALNRLTTLKYPDGEVLAYEYNPQGIEKITGQPANRQTGQQAYVFNIDYSPTGQPVYIKYGNNIETNYAYDPLTLRLTDLKTASGRLQDFHYEYDKLGNILNIREYCNTASQGFIYDDLDRLKSASGSYGAYNYDYDSIGNMTNKEGVVLAYGKQGKLPHAVTQDGDTPIDYDANGNMISRWVANKEAELSYDSENRLIKFTPVKEALEGRYTYNFEQPGWHLVYFPALGAKRRVVEVLNSNNLYISIDQVCRFNASTQAFEYLVNSSRFNQFDSFEPWRGYLIHVRWPGSFSLSVSKKDKPNLTLKPGYNLIGNPLYAPANVEKALAPLKLGIDYSKVFRYNNAKGAFEEYSLARKDFTRLKAQEAVFIHCLKDAPWPAGAEEIPELPIVEFTYDADGGRIKKTVSSAGPGNSAFRLQTTTYIGSLFEIGSDGSTAKHIFAGSQRICTITHNSSLITHNYYHSDHLGSSNVITGKDGRQAQLNEYAPFGSFTKNEPANRQTGQPANYYYTGKELDPTGLYYFGARYYDPAIARFITPDNFVPEPYNPQYLNRYSYCLNNPLRYIDPSGNSARNPTSDYGSSSWFSDVAASYGVSSSGSSYSGAMSGNSFSPFNNPFSSSGFGRYGALSGGLFTTADFLPAAGNYFANAQPFSPYATTGFAALGGFFEGISRIERFSRPGIFIVDRSNTIGWMGRVFQYDRPWRVAGVIATVVDVGLLARDLGTTFANPYLGFNQQIQKAAIQVIVAGVMWGVGYGVASTFNSTIPGVIISTALIAGADYLVNSIQNYLYGLWELG